MNNLNEAKVADLFGDYFQQQPELLVRAPGRVNLIGEHTDYNGGFVLPAAIDYHTWIAASGADDRLLQDDRLLYVVAQNMEQQQVVIDLDAEMQPDNTASWSNYVRGVIQQLRRNGFKLRGGKMLVVGNIPAGAGLSSSAALEMAVIRALTGLSGETVAPKAAALMGQAAENEFVGCNCGIMDQLISACGEANCALLIDCQDLSTRAVAIPTAWEILIVHSGVKRGLVDSEYNQRREQCETAAAYFGKRSLRDVSLEQLLAGEANLDALSFCRARHVLTENSRTLTAADALSRGDMGLLSKVMAESHASMRDDFEITTPEIDQLVDILNEAGQGQVGARMTGGGFGGCVVALAPRELMERLMAAVEDQYQTATGCQPLLIRARASAGAFM